MVDEGPVPGRSNMTYRWAHDETEVTFKVLIDGQWRTLTVGGRRHNLFYNRKGEVVARIVGGSGQRPTLVTSVGVLDRALADLQRTDGEPTANWTQDDNEPKLCQDPTPEPRTTDSKDSIEYQEYVSGLPYGLAINVGGVNFSGCDPKTGILLEAKAGIDFMFDDDDTLKWFIYPEKNQQFRWRDRPIPRLPRGASLSGMRKPRGAFED